MKNFGKDERYWMWGINGMKSWAYYCWAVENENTVWGKGIVRSTDGYLKQEIERIKHASR